MRSITLIITCGCGYKTTSIEEAANHCAKTGHTLTISGEIRPPEKPKE